MYWATLSNILSGRVKRFKRQPHKLETLGFDSLGPHPITNIGVIMMDKNKSTFLNNCYEWLFSEEERRPLAYIVAFFMTVLISTVVCLFIVTVDRHMNGIILWMFN